MHTNLLDATTRKITVGAIAGYQRYISPHKGFSCAHRILYGGESCSQFVKRVIIEAGVLTAVKASRQRFQSCKESNRILKARRMGICQNANYIHLVSNSSDPPAETPEDMPEIPVDGTERATKKANPNNNCNDCSSMVDCSYIGCDALNCFSGADCSAMDCSALSCSGADCSGCGDCGSCSW
jgi:putative component of membrane protein insertase Oxa1/YidC/SpoIIIJ protein YidD